MMNSEQTQDTCSPQPQKQCPIQADAKDKISTTSTTTTSVAADSALPRNNTLGFSTKRRREQEHQQKRFWIQVCPANNRFPTLQECYQFCAGNAPDCGAISTFVGITRNNFNGKRVVKLSYQGYIPMAEKELRKLCHEVMIGKPTNRTAATTTTTLRTAETQDPISAPERNQNTNSKNNHTTRKDILEEKGGDRDNDGVNNDNNAIMGETFDTADCENDVQQEGRFPTVQRIAMVHRLGDCPVGEASVIIAVASPHRGEAIHCCEFLINELKARIPIWKLEVYDDDDDGGGDQPQTSVWKENVEWHQGKKQRVMVKQIEETTKLPSEKARKTALRTEVDKDA